ncbi:hypothetical protein Bca4012_073760 [Brassica carinata]|uniref:Uncharacterized protein n=2 Tax=Brassica TaxID=3705 RepID=A0A8X7U9R4_BRACI|nr:uncharacterized protein LOC106383744 [Brassica napus]KAG2271515.1 hypothetical protein Bca52824_066070 [Brassica carinata]CAF1933052.1 unnamed protein product [Brassica napus]
MEISRREHVSSVHQCLSVSFHVSLIVRCARYASRVSKKLKLKGRPKELLTTLSNKAKTMAGRKKKAYDGCGGTKAKTGLEMVIEEEEEEEYGIWQRKILMGDKCEPLCYSGVIFYDCSGHQVKELPPRSPCSIWVPDRPTRSHVGSVLSSTEEEF